MNSVTFEVRPYQKQLIAGIYEAWKVNRRVLAQSPTGSGKTHIFGLIAKDFLCRGEKVLVIAHRQELIQQAATKISTIASSEVGIIKAGIKPNPQVPIQVASIQSLVNRLSCLESPALVVIDEAHHTPANTYRKVLEAYSDSYVLGVTATPIRADGSGFQDLFDDLVTGASVRDLIEQGYLSRYRLFGDNQPMTTKGARVQAGDYLTGDIAKLNNPVELSGHLIRNYRRFCNGKRTLVFAINVNHSREIALRYNRAGIRAAHLDGNASTDERSKVLKQFADGKLQVLTNCALFSEGLDIPGIEAVQIASPTKSLVKWLQMVGRALRPSPDKDCAIILDHTLNWKIHGLPDRPRIWTLEGVQDVQPMQTIQSEKGEVTEAPAPLEIVENKAILQEVDPTIEEPQYCKAFQRLLKTQERKGYASGWLYHKLSELKPPLEVWQDYARMKGYKPGWAYHRWREHPN